MSQGENLHGDYEEDDDCDDANELDNDYQVNHCYDSDNELDYDAKHSIAQIGIFQCSEAKSNDEVVLCNCFNPKSNDQMIPSLL